MDFTKSVKCHAVMALMVLLGTHQPLAEVKVLDYKPLDFGLEIQGIRKTEIECLTRNIYFEVATEDAIGKLAVAMATLNRVNHSKFLHGFKRERITVYYNMVYLLKRSLLSWKRSVKSLMKIFQNRSTG